MEIYGVIESGTQEDLTRLFYGNEAGHLMGNLKILIGLFKIAREEEVLEIVYRNYFD